MFFSANFNLPGIRVVWMRQLRAFAIVSPELIGVHYPEVLPSLVVVLLERLLVQLHKNIDNLIKIHHWLYHVNFYLKQLSFVAHLLEISSFFLPFAAVNILQTFLSFLVFPATSSCNVEYFSSMSILSASFSFSTFRMDASLDIVSSNWWADSSRSLSCSSAFSNRFSPVMKMKLISCC